MANMQANFDRSQIEKIVTAIYFVTHYVHDSDPLKWRLRELSVGMLENSVRDIIKSLDEIDTLMSVARTSGALSDMNGEIVQDACRLVVNRHKETHQLPKDFFDTTEENSSEQSVENVPQQKQEPQKQLTGVRNPDIKRHVVKTNDTSKRRDGIVAFLDKNSPATTTDIKKVVRGVSEKTIQRDLKWLIKRGVVERQGTRRWAKYSLV